MPGELKKKSSPGTKRHSLVRGEILYRESSINGVQEWSTTDFLTFCHYPISNGGGYREKGLIVNT